MKKLKLSFLYYFHIIFINTIMVFIQTIEDLKNITENDIELIFDDNFNKKIIIPTFLLHKKLNKVEVGI